MRILSILNSAFFLCCLSFSPANALPDPDACGGGCFSFTLAGEIHGLPADSQFSSYVKNGDHYTASGYFSSTGYLYFKQLKVEPDPGAGGGGGFTIAMPDPGMGGGGSTIAMPDPGLGGPGEGKTILTIQPDFTFDHGVLHNIHNQSLIKFVFDDPTGAMTLDNLNTFLPKLEGAEFPSLGFSGSSFTEAWHPTVTAYQLDYTPVPEPSTLALLASGLAGVGIVRKRFKKRSN